MTRYAIISDIHSNKVALDAVLKDINRRRISYILCLGDIVGYGARPNECVELVRENGVISVRGNHDDIVGNRRSADSLSDNARISLEWTQKNISEENRMYLKQLSLTLKFPEFAITHSSLTQPQNFNYTFGERECDWTDFFECPQKSTKNDFSKLAGNVNLCFIGHTHRILVLWSQKIKGWCPELRSDKSGPRINLKLEENVYIINPGSVGQPRDYDPRASYAVFDTSAATVTYHQVCYDIARTQAQIRQAGLPARLSARLSEGR